MLSKPMTYARQSFSLPFLARFRVQRRPPRPSSPFAFLGFATFAQRDARRKGAETFPNSFPGDKEGTTEKELAKLTATRDCARRLRLSPLAPRTPLRGLRITRQDKGSSQDSMEVNHERRRTQPQGNQSFQDLSRAQRLRGPRNQLGMPGRQYRHHRPRRLGHRLHRGERDVDEPRWLS